MGSAGDVYRLGRGGDRLGQVRHHAGEILRRQIHHGMITGCTLVQLERLGQSETECLAVSVGPRRSNGAAHHGGQGIGIERGFTVERQSEHAAIAGGRDMARGGKDKAEAAIAILAAGAHAIGGMRAGGGQQKRHPHQADSMCPRCQAEIPFQPGQYRAAALTFGKL